MTNGDLQRAVLFKSSGDPDWDRAALDCANGYRFGESTATARRPEIDWVLTFGKSSTGSGFMEAMIDPKPSNSRYGSPIPIRGIREATKPMKTVIAYRIQVDGTVSDPTVIQSSGVPGLDQTAARCVTTWKFYPATQNGVPVTFTQEFAANWNLR